MDRMNRTQTFQTLIALAVRANHLRDSAVREDKGSMMERFWLDMAQECERAMKVIECQYAGLDPTPADETPVSFDDNDWRNGEVYHEPVSFYLDSESF